MLLQLLDSVLVGIIFVAACVLFVYLFIKFSDLLQKKFPKAFPEGAKDLAAYTLVSIVAVLVLALIGEVIKLMLPL